MAVSIGLYLENAPTSMNLRVKTRTRAAIAHRRENAAIRAATRLSVVTLNAVRNQYNWDLAANGETWTLQWALCNQAGAVFDVGSNQGQWAMHALPHTHGRPIHCFEAVPATFEYLQTNLSNADSVSLNSIGLGSKADTVEFDYCPRVSDVSSRYGVPTEFQAGPTERITVKIATGDEYCLARGIDRIAILKVDVEGMEYEVLDGFRWMLGEQKIGVIQFEYGPGYIGARRYLKDVCELLEGAHYKLFRQFPKGLESFTYSETDEDFRARNFVAVACKVATD